MAASLPHQPLIIQHSFRSDETRSSGAIAKAAEEGKAVAVSVACLQL
ncbi:hypothetical protein MPEAHAMD_6919 [Methylobacterium frigidaeris]|uniref:Uncharacterized protein n=1 Tax=Methylobacterium frigidaeris TaxID=2038277 RepID=A0AA37HIZ3_9HYPH|nr:hypothetical protein MPEAHAMD_6919 [Methylobacterium frigidaeris]